MIMKRIALKISMPYKNQILYGSLVKKWSWTLFCLCSLNMSLSQDIVFLKNTNPAAKELDQSLSATNDSLILKSSKIIQQVDIFNETFKKSILINDLETKIDLKDLPLGEYVVQAISNKKWIVMYVVKSDKSKQLMTKQKSDAIGQLNTRIANSKNAYLTKEEFFARQRQKATKIGIRKQAIFWVVSETKMGSGSGKSMALKSEREVMKLIEKNKLELNSQVAKYNTLSVYEVYDVKQFMRKQFRNPEFFKSEHSNIFNAKPFYTSEPKSTGI